MAKYGRGHRRTRELIVRLKTFGVHICHLCGEPIDMSLVNPHPRSWNLDHYIPVSKGGHPYSPENARESHRECNLARGNKSVEKWFASRIKGTFHKA
jgi:5-methylcytosine-specific restriction endonuclease McrA